MQMQINLCTIFCIYILFCFVSRENLLDFATAFLWNVVFYVSIIFFLLARSFFFGWQNAILQFYRHSWRLNAHL